MKLATYNTPEGTSNTLRIEKPCASVLLAVAFTHDYDSVGQTNGFDMLQKVLGSSTIAGNYINKDGNVKRLFSSIPVVALAELNQREEGVIKFLDDVLYIPLALGFEGMIPFSNDEIYELSFNWATDNGVTIESVNVHSIESPQFSNFLYEYDLKSIVTGKKQVDFDISKFENILIPVSAITASTELLFKNSNGQTIRFKKEELIAMSILSNDLVYEGTYNDFNPTGEKFAVSRSAYNQYFIMNVETYESLEISRDSTTAFDIVAQMSYLVEGNRQKVERKNILIQNVAGKRLEMLSNQIK